MRRVRVVLAIALLALAGCATKGPLEDASGAAASHALKMVGKPYKYGGSGPSGFDCSGLVQYSFKQAGVSVARDTEKQRSASRPVKRAELRRGDLLFFNQEGKKYGHVAIYAGDGRFVHAPSSGKSVRTDRLDNPYWKKHLSEARRLQEK
jgi:cell wall-associated NlpC family hydrolase